MGWILIVIALLTLILGIASWKSDADKAPVVNNDIATTVKTTARVQRKKAVKTQKGPQLYRYQRKGEAKSNKKARKRCNRATNRWHRHLLAKHSS